MGGIFETTPFPRSAKWCFAETRDFAAKFLMSQISGVPFVSGLSFSPFCLSASRHIPGQGESPAREEGGARAFWRGQLTFSLANPVQAASTAAYKVLKHWREHRRSPTGPVGIAMDKYIITNVPRISLIIWWRHGTHERLETRER